MSLKTLDAQAWALLGTCADNREGAYRNLTLSTVDSDGQPQSRILILRRADIKDRALWFHTDLRSSKWHALTANARVSVLGYDPARALQLRLTGTAELHPPKTEVTTKAWSGLPEWTRRTYSGASPGTPVAAGEGSGVSPHPADRTGVGYSVFCVITVRIRSLDWYSHPRDNIRRVQFQYDEQGQLNSAQEVNP